jgi:hypothetical protein
MPDLEMAFAYGSPVLVRRFLIRSKVLIDVVADDACVLQGKCSACDGGTTHLCFLDS